MAAKSHTKAFEAVISRACSDPGFKHGAINTNPIVRLWRCEEEFRYRMVPVFCEIAGYTLAADRSTQMLAVYDENGVVVGGISLKNILVLPETSR
jgi:hypothetical protein